MLTRAIKETIATALTIKGQGEEIQFNVTYHNRKQSEIDAKVAEDGGGLAAVLLYMVESWETEYPLTEDGIKEMEDDRPGMTMAIILGFHESRRVAKEKN